LADGPILASDRAVDWLLVVGVAALSVEAPVFTVIDRDAKDPGGEPGLSAKAVEGLVDRKEDVLRDLFRDPRVSHPAKALAVDPILVAGDQGGEGMLITTLKAADEIFVRLRLRHSEEGENHE
jgi:hypothetical protein